MPPPATATSAPESSSPYAEPATSAGTGDAVERDSSPEEKADETAPLTRPDAESGGATSSTKQLRDKWSEKDQPWHQTGKHVDMELSKFMGPLGQWITCIVAVGVLAGYFGWFGLLPTGPATLIVSKRATQLEHSGTH